MLSPLARSPVAPFVAILALAVASPLASAQSPLASSESFVAVNPTASGGGASPASSSFSGSGTSPFTFSGPLASSESFTALSAALDDGTLTGGRPMVAGVSAGLGTKDGGTLVDVFGFGFTDPGAGLTTVEFDGIPAPVVFVVGNTRIGARTPVGVNQHGNPLGSVDVDVTNDLGSSSADDGFLFLPALTAGDPARVGGFADVYVHSDPGSFVLVVYGVTSPGTALPVEGLDGALEFVTGYWPLSTFMFSATGTVGISIPVPDDASLIGFAAQMQGVVVDAVVPAVTGAFTNVLPVVLQP